MGLIKRWKRRRARKRASDTFIRDIETHDRWADELSSDLERTRLSRDDKGLGWTPLGARVDAFDIEWPDRDQP